MSIRKFVLNGRIHVIDNELDDYIKTLQRGIEKIVEVAPGAGEDVSYRIASRLLYTGEVDDE